jgi:hypothetical protein
MATVGVWIGSLAELLARLGRIDDARETFEAAFAILEKFTRIGVVEEITRLRDKHFGPASRD